MASGKDRRRRRRGSNLRAAQYARGAMARQLIPARRLAWLQRELAAWRSDGLVDDAAAAAIAERYEASSRARAARVLLTLGAALVGVGIIWLVASNLDIDEAGPLTRFAFVAALWLAFVALA